MSELQKVETIGGTFNMPRGTLVPFEALKDKHIFVTRYGSYSVKHPGFIVGPNYTFTCACAYRILNATTEGEIKRTHHVCPDTLVRPVDFWDWLKEHKSQQEKPTQRVATYGLSGDEFFNETLASRGI